jgi:two-component system NtrC family sensor kinase
VSIMQFNSDNFEADAWRERLRDLLNQDVGVEGVDRDTLPAAVQALQEQSRELISELEERNKIISSLDQVSPLLLEGITLDKMLSTILNNVLNCFRYYRGVVYLWDKHKENLVCHGTAGLSPESESIIRSRPLNLQRHDCVEIRAAQSSTYTLVQDTETDPALTKLDMKISHQHGGRGAVLYVPLRSKGQTYGVLGVESHPKRMEQYPGQFRITEKNIRSMMLFVNHASIAIENARLYEQNERKIRYLIKLQEIYQQLNGILDIDQLTEKALDFALELSQSTSGAIWLCDEAGHTASARHVRGYAAHQGSIGPLTIDNFPFAPACVEPRPVFVSDVSKLRSPLALSPHTGCTLLIPLTYENRMAAVLQLDIEDRDGPDETTQEVLKLFASHIGKLIENVKLYDRLLVERHFIDNVIESAGIGILITDGSGKILSANTKIENLFGIAAAQAVGQPVGQVFSGDSRFLAKVVLDSTRKRKEQEREVRYERNELELTLKVMAFVVQDGQSTLSGVTTFLHDITEKRRLSESLRKIEKMAAVATMAAGLAHELRNPLSGIYATVQTLTRELTLSQSQKQEMDAILEEVQRMETLIQDVLHLSKPFSLRLRKTDVNAVLLNSMAALQERLAAKKIELKPELADDLALVRADADKLRQVFLNLIINAADASKHGGVVKVLSRPAYTPKNRRLSGVLVEIIDQGEGITAENVSRIFDPFFSTKNDGTGLGLTICERIVEQHGGKLMVRSDPGQGSAFSVYLKK